MAILGISAYYHDSAAAIVEGDTVLAAAQEERFTRIKHDPSFPLHSIKFCLDYAGKSINDLEAVVFYDKPFLKFERLLETYLTFAPKGINSFIASMPVWLKQKLFLKDDIYRSLNKIEKTDKRKIRLLFSEHHLSHAASAFYPSPFPDAAIVTIDGVGEWATTTIGMGNGNDISILKEMHFPNSVGLLYSAFTYYCGFKVNSGEYKLMGLAPYGNKNSERTRRFIEIIQQELCKIHNDGSITLNLKYFDFPTGLKMTNKKWEQLFGFAERPFDSKPEQHYCDLACAIQNVTEEIVIKLASEAKRLTGKDRLCMAGGVALNCVANGILERKKIFKELFIQPASGDAGGALGAALAANYIYFNKERNIAAGERDKMQGAFLGNDFSEEEVKAMLKKYKPSYERLEEEELLKCVAQLLANGKVIAWYQGRMEFGPRALGARSIIADARNPVMQKKINERIKFREDFRPFAPMVLAEDAGEYFDVGEDSPYMMLTYFLKEAYRKPLPSAYNDMGFSEKLHFFRSELPAITHVDFSARVQTVHKDLNERLWKLLRQFKQLTGCSVLVNTSFNVRGEPIVNTPEDAYKCFMYNGNEIDYLVIGNILFHKGLQPQQLAFNVEFNLD